jgi:hypothetical protein
LINFLEPFLKTSLSKSRSWQAEAALVAGTGDNSRVRHELAYYTTQVERWQGYLERLRTQSNGVASVPALMSLDLSPSG